jgi:hypothetical protein
VRYLIALLLFPVTVFAQFSETPVQSATGDTGSAVASSYTITLGAAPTAGNIIVLAAVGSLANNTKVTSTNTYWSQVIASHNNTGLVQAFLWVGYPQASAGTVITVASNVPGTSMAMAGVAAEFRGANPNIDAIGAPSTGSSTSPAVTLNASGHANALLIVALANRCCSSGGYSAQTAVYTSPTNSFKFVDGTTGAAGVAMRNTTINTTNSDRAVTLLVKVITDGAGVSAGASITTNQWSACGANLAEVQRGFFIP